MLNEQIPAVIVAVSEHERLVGELVSEFLEAATQSRPIRLVEPATREPVFEEVVEFPSEEACVEALAEGDASRVGSLGACALERDQLVDGAAVERGRIRRGLCGVPERDVADILEEREPTLGIRAVYGRARRCRGSRDSVAR